MGRLPTPGHPYGSTTGHLPRGDSHLANQTAAIVARIHTPSRPWVSRASLAERNALGGESAVAGTAAAEAVDQVIAVAITVTDRKVGVVVAATAGEGIVGAVDNAVGDVDVANGASVLAVATVAGAGYR